MIVNGECDHAARAGVLHGRHDRGSVREGEDAAVGVATVGRVAGRSGRGEPAGRAWPTPSTSTSSAPRSRSSPARRSSSCCPASSASSASIRGHTPLLTQIKPGRGAHQAAGRRGRGVRLRPGRLPRGAAAARDGARRHGDPRQGPGRGDGARGQEGGRGSDAEQDLRRGDRARRRPSSPARSRSSRRSASCSTAPDRRPAGTRGIEKGGSGGPFLSGCPASRYHVAAQHASRG